jgi:hypothetical protein
VGGGTALGFWVGLNPAACETGSTTAGHRSLPVSAYGHDQHRARWRCPSPCAWRRPSPVRLPCGRRCRFSVSRSGRVNECAARRGLSLIGTSIVDDFRNTITPVLTVRDAVRAVAFYERALARRRSIATPIQTVESLRRWPSGPPASGWPMKRPRQPITARGHSRGPCEDLPAGRRPRRGGVGGLVQHFLAVVRFASRRQGRSVTRVSLYCCQRAGRG